MDFYTRAGGFYTNSAYLECTEKSRVSLSPTTFFVYSFGILRKITNKACQRLSKDKKLKLFTVIPTDKKPDIIEDDITKMRFCSASCYRKAMDSYFSTFRGKWIQFKNIEHWILANKVLLFLYNIDYILYKFIIYYI